MSRYRPHRWRYLNGFWIECTCGWVTNAAWTMRGLAKLGDRHVQTQTAVDLAAVRINQTMRDDVEGDGAD